MHKWIDGTNDKSNQKPRDQGRWPVCQLVKRFVTTLHKHNDSDDSIPFESVNTTKNIFFEVLGTSEKSKFTISMYVSLETFNVRHGLYILHLVWNKSRFTLYFTYLLLLYRRDFPPSTYSDLQNYNLNPNHTLPHTKCSTFEWTFIAFILSNVLNAYWFNYLFNQ